MSWLIVIPSYHRSDTITKNTLRVLDECRTPHDRIKVFVADCDDDLSLYRSALPPDIEIIQSVKGCIQNRAFIRQFYPENQWLCYMDDDIKDISTICDMTPEHTTCHTMAHTNLGSPDYKKQIPLRNLCGFLDIVFPTLVKEEASFGGIYPIKNGFFARHRYTTDLRYCCGGMYFEINKRDFQVEGIDYAEDFMRTIQFFKRDGKVIRFEYVMLHTPYYSGKGGLVESRTVELSREAQQRVKDLYPDLCEVVPPTKNNKYWNLKLLRR